MDYPIWDIAIGGGVLMGVVAIAHVIVAHFAIGGGLLIAATETRAVRSGDREMRELARRSSLLLILVSTVFGAISGVGIWVVAGLISPSTISALIRNYVWGWAIEWTFFIVEIVAALVYYATWDRVSKRVHVAIGWIYFVAAYLSLVIINGIVTFMLTPGDWLATRAFWDGFFNPTYWPSLLLRTGIAMMMAVAFMGFVAWRGAEGSRLRLSRWLGWWMLAGVLVSYVGYRWWEGVLPDGIRSLFLDEPASLDALAGTRSFLVWALAVALVVVVVTLFRLPRAVRLAALVLVALASFSFFGGYERLREGVRKPFLIHDYIFSNGLRVDDIERVNEEGALATARWAARSPARSQADTGRQLFRAQCQSCHTIDGYQAIRPLLPDDPDMNFAVLYMMREQGQAYVDAAPGEPVDKGELDYPFMPPFVGTEDEMYALVDYLAGLKQDHGDEETDPAEAGVEP
jgi:mono/diheme cytochrome c family protein